MAGVQLGGMGSVRSVAASERAASPSMVVKVEENAFAPRPEPTAKILQPLKGGCRFLADFGVVPVMFYAILWPEPCLVEGVTHPPRQGIARGITYIITDTHLHL